METSKQNNKEQAKPQTAPQAQGRAEGSEATEAVVSQLDLRFRDEIADQPGGENIRRCFACGTCAAGCPVTEVDS